MSVQTFRSDFVRCKWLRSALWSHWRRRRRQFVWTHDWSSPSPGVKARSSNVNLQLKPRITQLSNGCCSFAYFALASFRMGMSGSAYSCPENSAARDWKGAQRYFDLECLREEI